MPPSETGPVEPLALSRRHFIRAGAAVLVSAGLPLPAGVLLAGNAEAAPSPAGAPLTRLGSGDVFASSSNFVPCLHTVFNVQLGPSRAVDLVLSELTDLPVPNSRRGLGNEARFSLLFDGSGAPAFTQGTYGVRHPRLGRFALFLVPVGRSGGDYEAIVNRVHA